MLSSFYLAPGVYYNEVPFSRRPAPSLTSTGGFVIQSSRGRTSAPRWVNDNADVTTFYGRNVNGYGYGQDSLRAFMDVARGAYVYRITGAGSKYAFGVVANNIYRVEDPAAPGTFIEVKEGTTITPSLFGSSVGYEEIDARVYDVLIPMNIPATSAITVQVSADASEVAFTGQLTHNESVRAIVQALMFGFISEDREVSASPVERQTSDGYDDSGNYIPADINYRIIRLIMLKGDNPNGMQIKVDGTPLVFREADWSYIAVAENQGVWADGSALALRSVDTGIKQRTRMQFTGNFGDDQELTFRINDTLVGPITLKSNVGNRPGVLTDIATAVLAALPGTRYTLDVRSYGYIDFEFPTPTEYQEFSEVAVAYVGTGTAPVVPVIIARDIVKPAPSGVTVAMSYYENNNFRTALDIWKGTLEDSADANNRPIGLVYQVNEGPSMSQNIRLVANPNNPYPKLLSDTAINVRSREGFLGGGDDGSAVTDADVINGWSVYEDVTKYSIRLAVNAGYATVAVHQAMAELCFKRRDAVAILDMPSDRQDAERAINYRRSELGIDNNYAALYTPDIQIKDKETSQNRWTCPSGYVAAQFAYTDKVRKEWFSPAGINRGVINAAIDLRVKYKPGDQDNFDLNQINPILTLRDGRHVIMNDNSLRYTNDVLQPIPVRRLCNTIEIMVSDYALRGLFEPNDDWLGRMLCIGIDDLLEEVARGRGIWPGAENRQVLSNGQNNSPAELDARNRHVLVWFRPLSSAKRIIITAAPSDLGVEFTEVIGELISQQ